MQSSFQAGVSTLYNKCTSWGITPSSNSPTAIASSIDTIANNRWEAGRLEVATHPNNYNLFTAEQYNANYTRGYNEGFSAGKNDATIQTREVSGSQNNFSSYTDYGLDRSVKINPPSLSGYTITGAYIKKIYISNTNKAFGSGTFEVMKSGSSYYVISKDCTWPSGGTSVNATVTFIYQK